MHGYDTLESLPVTIDSCELIRHERPTSSGFDRVTTELRLHGDGHTGRGEDVIYEASLHEELLDAGPPPLAGEYEFGTFSEIVGELDLFPSGDPERDAYRNYRRWGFESAALDLTLRQADVSLADALDGTYEPVRFLVSTRLGDPPTTDRLDELRRRVPEPEFKLDPTSEWDEELIDKVAATDAVRVLDLKGHYEGTDVDQPPDVDLYRSVLSAFPEAVIEDPTMTEATEPLFEGESERLSWDAPVHGVDDIEALPDAGWLNVKPSRFGSVESVLSAFEYCEAHGIDTYLGGQFELGPGRMHLHALASLYCPDGPNDVAPQAYNEPTLDDDLPASPLDPPSTPRGLAWDASR